MNQVAQKEAQRYMFVPDYLQDGFLEFVEGVYFGQSIYQQRAPYKFTSPVPSMEEFFAHESIWTYVRDCISKDLYGDPWQHMDVRACDDPVYFNELVKSNIDKMMFDFRKTLNRHYFCYTDRKYCSSLINAPMSEVW